MQQWLTTIIASVVMSGMGVGVNSVPPVLAKDLSLGSSRTVTVEFRVASVKMKKLDGARILVIDDRGKVIESGVTSREGVWDAHFVTPLDRRFLPVKKMGTVTAILFADGYNEAIIFDVPVEQGQIQPVMLNPIVPNQRNEPTAQLGAIHRHTYMELIRHYAELQKLKKQPPIPGEVDYAPWGPHTR